MPLTMGRNRIVAGLDVHKEAYASLCVLCVMTEAIIFKKTYETLTTLLRQMRNDMLFSWSHGMRYGKHNGVLGSGMERVVRIHGTSACPLISSINFRDARATPRMP